MRLLAISFVVTLGQLALANVVPEEKDRPSAFAACNSNPCLEVPGVGLLKGTMQQSTFQGRDFYSYFSIPYAKPTSGNLRFAPPVKEDQLNGGGDTSNAYDATYATFILNALKNICPQPGGLGSFMDVLSRSQPDLNMTLPKGQEGKALGTEDCLRLSVFSPVSPAEAPNANLPVMFFIHGGAFYQGTYMGHGANNLLEKDVIVVEVQYRLGPLGFMCLDHPEIAGNMGLLDQVMALQWVQDNIAAFGGDPNQITIFGESAGSVSVSYHMVSPLSQNKFQRIIGQSGSALAGWGFDYHPLHHASQIAKEAGCPHGEENLDAMVNCLKNQKTTQEIVNAHKTYIDQERLNGGLGFGGSTPCAQTQGNPIFINKHPEDYFRNNEFSPKQVMFGANKDEGSFVLGVIYTAYIKANNLEFDEAFLNHEFIPVMLNALGLDDTSGVIFEILEHDYFDYKDLGIFDKMMPGMINLVGAFFIKASSHELMRYNFINGGDSYFYSLDYEGAHTIFNVLFAGESEIPNIPHGVTHGDDLIYVFKTTFNVEGDDARIAHEMVQMWTNFAIYGEPTPAANPVANFPSVPKWTEDNPTYVRINTVSDLKNDYITSWNDPLLTNTCKMEEE